MPEPTAELKIKPTAEIQAAHDLIGKIIMDPNSPPDIRDALHLSLLPLCWVLCHKNGAELDELLGMLTRLEKVSKVLHEIHGEAVKNG